MRMLTPEEIREKYRDMLTKDGFPRFSGDLDFGMWCGYGTYTYGDEWAIGEDGYYYIRDHKSDPWRKTNFAVRKEMMVIDRAEKMLKKGRIDLAEKELLVGATYFQKWSEDSITHLFWTVKSQIQTLLRGMRKGAFSKEDIEEQVSHIIENMEKLKEKINESKKPTTPQKREDMELEL